MNWHVTLTRKAAREIEEQCNWLAERSSGKGLKQMGRSCLPLRAAAAVPARSDKQNSWNGLLP